MYTDEFKEAFRERAKRGIQRSDHCVDSKEQKTQDTVSITIHMS